MAPRTPLSGMMLARAQQPGGFWTGAQETHSGTPAPAKPGVQQQQPEQVPSPTSPFTFPLRTAELLGQSPETATSSNLSKIPLKAPTSSGVSGVTLLRSVDFKCVGLATWASLSQPPLGLTTGSHWPRTFSCRDLGTYWAFAEGLSQKKVYRLSSALKNIGIKQDRRSLTASGSEFSILKTVSSENPRRGVRLYRQLWFKTHCTWSQIAKFKTKAHS